LARHGDVVAQAMGRTGNTSIQGNEHDRQLKYTSKRTGQAAQVHITGNGKDKLAK